MRAADAGAVPLRGKDRAVRTAGIVVAVNTKVEEARLQLLKMPERTDVEAVTVATARNTVQERFFGYGKQRADDRNAVDQEVVAMQSLRGTACHTSQARFTALENQHEIDRDSFEDHLAGMRSGIALRGANIVSVLNAVTVDFTRPGNCSARIAPAPYSPAPLQ